MYNDNPPPVDPHDEEDLPFEDVIETAFFRIILQIADPRWEAFWQQQQDFILEAMDTAYGMAEDVPVGEASVPVVEVTLRLSSNHEVQQLNQAYRGKDKPTNVLSFPFMDSGESEEDIAQVLEMMEADQGDDFLMPLGDLILAFETCHREALAHEREFAHHVGHLVIHGILHLLGYDHEQGEEDAEEMESLEIAILTCFNIPNPYLIQED